MKKQPKVTIVDIEDLVPDDKNANKHSEYGMGLLENSTRMNGAGRSILISNDNKIIAGNGFAESAGHIGLKEVIVVETDGNQVVAVKRTDIKSGTKEFYNMAMADNVTALKNIVMDAEVIEAIVTEHPEVKFWQGALYKEKKEGVVDNDAADMTKVEFQLKGSQSTKLKKAIKVSKQWKKPPKEVNANSFALMTMIDFFLKNYKS